jgi:hypothetical protein
LVTATKHPGRVAAGKATALKRWGPLPRTVRLDSLLPEERRLVVALVEAMKTAPAIEAPDAVRPEVRRERATPTD